jgi:hypothetical protein
VVVDSLVNKLRLAVHEAAVSTSIPSLLLLHHHLLLLLLLLFRADAEV